MRSELFRIPIEAAGVPIFGVGVLLAVWAAALVGILLWMSRKPNARREITAQLPVFAGVTAAIIGLPWVMPEGLPIRGYGVMLLLAASTGLAMAIHRAGRRGVPADTVLSMAFAMFVLGILGARVFFVVRYWGDVFAPHGLAAGLRKALLFTEGGLVVYGSLVGGAVAFLWFTRRAKLPVLAMADVIAPSLVAGLAIGRIGCLLNGCCYGGVCDRPWAITFPRYHTASDAGPRGAYSPPYGDQLAHGQMHGFRLAAAEGAAGGTDRRVLIAGVTPGLADTPGAGALRPGAEVAAINGAEIGRIEDAQFAITKAYELRAPLTLSLAGGAQAELPAAPVRARSLPVHPTQLYSALNAGLLAWVLWLYYPLRRRDGEVAALLLTVYPITRFLLEAIRTDDSLIRGTGLTTAQNVSVLLLAAMAPAWLLLLRTPAGRTERLAPA
ncbi:MAG: prolipoprotein diacylglyceryl transferase family protein [Planctomycetota bacterium]